jgi:hypothetical protein
MTHPTILTYFLRIILGIPNVEEISDHVFTERKLVIVASSFS